jgi:hypothetical protein
MPQFGAFLVLRICYESRERRLQDDITAEFRKSLNSLIGQPCWSVIAGRGTGSVISLHFGNKIPLQQPIKNSYLSEEQQKYEGELILFIECVWRIDSEAEVICGCWEDNAKDGSMLIGLQNIIGQKVESINLSSPAWDLAINFSNSMVLRIFCDQTNLMEAVDNYSFSSLEVTYTVSTRSKLQQEHREFI